MKHAVTIRLGIRPLPQPRQRSGKGGRSYLSDEEPIHAYKAQVRRALELEWRGRGLVSAPVSVQILFVFPRLKSYAKYPLRYPFTGRGGDGDNLEKAIWDAMTGTVIADDRQIWEWSGRKIIADPGGEPMIEIRMSW